MYKKKEGEGGNYEIDDTATLGLYARTNISRDQNLVVNPNAFSVGE